MRPLKCLFLQLGNQHSHKDETELTHRGFRTRNSMSWAYVSYEPGTYSDGLYYVASFVLDQLPNVEVDICQMMWGDDPADYSLSEYDYILASGLGTHFRSNLPALQLVQDRKGPNTVTIMGGAHATFAPYEALEYADYAILGEGEVPTVQLIHCLEGGGALEDIDNLCYVDDAGHLVMNEVKRYGNLHNTINPILLDGAPDLPWAPVSMSRGCPYNCSFCYAVRLLGRELRLKEITDIRREVDGIAQKTGCNRFLVTDLNFGTNKQFCQEVAREFHGDKYRFIGLTRIEIADEPELVSDLRKAGFDQYYFGIESEDPTILKAFNKKVDGSLQTQRLMSMKEHDVFVHAGLIFGLGPQDVDSMEHTARWCAETGILHPNFYCLTDYPFQKLLYGSRQDVEDHRIIMEGPNYQHFTFVGIYPRHMPPSKLQRALVKCYEIFFARANELETKPARRVRLKAFERWKAAELAHVEQHIEMLERVEKGYYTQSGELKEDKLKADYENRWGKLRDWIGESDQAGGEMLIQLPA